MDLSNVGVYTRLCVKSSKFAKWRHDGHRGCRRGFN